MCHSPLFGVANGALTKCTHGMESVWDLACVRRSWGILTSTGSSWQLLLPVLWGAGASWEGRDPGLTPREWSHNAGLAELWKQNCQHAIPPSSSSLFPSISVSMQIHAGLHTPIHTHPYLLYRTLKTNTISQPHRASGTYRLLCGLGGG